MLANDRYLFIHYPKTAGKSLTRYFIEAWDRPMHGIVSPGQIKELEPAITDGVHVEEGLGHENLATASEILASRGQSVHDMDAVFVGVRNPYDLAVSTYFYLRDRAKHHEERPRFRRAVSLDFETFWCTDIGLFTSPPERWLTLDGRTLPNQRFIRFESIASDITRFADEFGFNDADLPHLNPTPHEHYSAYMTPKVEEALFTRFRFFFDSGLYARERVRPSWRQVLKNPSQAVRSAKRERAPPAPERDITEQLETRLANAEPKDVVELPPGNFSISRTIRLPSDITIRGAGSSQTRLVLAPNANVHMFVNANQRKGNDNITIEGLLLDGNGRKQCRQTDEGLTRCIILLRRVKGAILADIAARDGVQSAIHLTTCKNVTIDGLDVADMAWSGIGSTGSNGLSVTNSCFRLTGTAGIHSAVHLNGGSGIHIACAVDLSAGNGVMLNSRFSPLENVVVTASCKHCRNGIVLLGDLRNRLHNVLLKSCDVVANDLGIQVSNSANVFIDGCRVADSWETGLLLEGRHGAKFVVVTDTRFEGNAEDVQEIHASANNHFPSNSYESNVPFVPKPPDSTTRPRALDSYSGVCTVCGSTSLFEHDGGSVRESYRCGHCRSSLRYRGQAKAILETFGSGEQSIRELAQSDEFSALAIYEPGLVGPFRRHFKELPNYSQSYFWEDTPLGAVKDGVPNHDLQALGLPSDSVDLAITSDIFEHIRRPYEAFAEMHRVLRMGGSHVFTVPLQFPMPKKTVVRVDTTTDKDVHLLPEVYHSAGEGGKSLVYTDFGEDMIARLDEIGFSTAISFIDRDRPLCAKNITFVSTKARA